MLSRFKSKLPIAPSKATGALASGDGAMLDALQHAAFDDFLARTNLSNGHVATARFSSVSSVDVDGVRLRFKKALVATGSISQLPTIPGLAEAGYLTNAKVFDIDALPASLLVIGGGRWAASWRKSLAMVAGMGLDALAGVIHAYPTQGEGDMPAD